jgi:hypothetical protein
VTHCLAPSREYSVLGASRRFSRRFGNIAINYIYIMYITIYTYITTIYESQKAILSLDCSSQDLEAKTRGGQVSRRGQVSGWR